MKSESRPNLREIVRSNCIALFLHANPERKTMSWSGLAADAHIGNGTAQRINEMSSDPSLATLDAIAQRYGLEAWHLLLPHLDPRNPPAFVMTYAERALYDKLAQSVRAVAEQQAVYERVK